MATLADIIRNRRSSGQSRTGSLFGSLKDKLKEKIDPRQMFNQTGILTSLFPSLKAYKASADRSPTTSTKPSLEQLSVGVQSAGVSLSTIETNTSISAKNSMFIPVLARDMNIMRQNLSKFVKIFGSKSEDKTDSFFKRSRDMEKEFEKKFSRMKSKKLDQIKEPTKEEEGGKGLGFLGALGKILTSLVSGIVGVIKTVMTSITAIIKSLITTLITSLVSIVTSAIKMLMGTVTKMLKSIGKALLGAFRIKELLPALLRSLFLSPLGAKIILAGLLYMGLKNLAKDYIEGKKAKDRLKELRALIADGLASAEQIQEAKVLEQAGVTTGEREAIGKATTGYLDLETTNAYLDKGFSDAEIRKDIGVSREILEAYREGLLNRSALNKAGLSVPNLHEVAASFGEKVDRTSPISVSTTPSTPSFLEERMSPVPLDNKGKVINNRTPSPEEMRQILFDENPISGAAPINPRSPEQRLNDTSENISDVNSATLRNNALRSQTAAGNVVVLPTASSQDRSSETTQTTNKLPEVVNVNFPIKDLQLFGLQQYLLT
jgi:hypothetical protein